MVAATFQLDEIEPSGIDWNCIHVVPVTNEDTGETRNLTVPGHQDNPGAAKEDAAIAAFKHLGWRKVSAAVPLYRILVPQ